ncbi:MAG TPA: hypothetical protein VHC73_01910 [Vitreimonas sp.]|jgi:hypothetical protein|nr:hypothetical protein [Vitreimonas sp.]
MFWVFIVIAVAAIVGFSWLAGSFINKRSAPGQGPRRPMTKQEKIRAASVAGAFPIRKEGQN